MKQDEMTICECVEYLDSMVGDDENIKGCLDYIERKAKAMDKRLREYKSIFEEEKQQETNLERYFDDLTIFGINSFAVINGKPMRCKDVHCDKCDFCGHCGGERLIWLTRTYKKPPYKLSQFEYDLIQTYSYVHEGYTLSKFKRLIKLKDKGYFKCVDYDTKIHDILENCEVIK
nr:MAG TPA_asm: DNA-binding stress response protein [Caudoviricetes sp.]